MTQTFSTLIAALAITASLAAMTAPATAFEATRGAGIAGDDLGSGRVSDLDLGSGR